MFSRRSGDDTDQNALTYALVQRRKRGEEVLDLTESNPTHAGIRYDREAILGALSREESLVYDPAPLGLRVAREAVASTYGVHPDSVVITASTSEAYSFLFKLLCDPGDELLAPRPSYPLFEHLALLEGVTLRSYRLAYDGAWHVDVPSLRRAQRERCCAVLAVSPNNPTGSLLRLPELRAMEDLGLPVVCDEVFASYMHIDPVSADAVRCAAKAAGHGLVVSLGGLSKLAGLPQLKVAWMILGGHPAKVSEARRRLEGIADAFLSVSAPVQHALPRLLETRSVAEDRILERARRNLAMARDLTAGTAVSVLHVEAGWYATLRVPKLASEEELALALLADGVLVHPGYFFDFEEEAHLIVSLLTPEASFDEGMKRILARCSPPTG
ncbi:pyridoxal phosphate-dependent aminotransferase [soil metagenome]